MLLLPSRLLLVFGFLAFVGVVFAANGPAVTDNELMNQAIADYNGGDFASAEEKINQFIERRPDLGDGYFNRALARVALEKFAEAESDLDVYLSLEPKSAPAFELRAALRLQRGNVAGALGDANVGLRLEDRPELRAVRGRILTAKGDYEAALKDLESALAANEDNDDARFARGECYLQLGRLKEARDDFEVIMEYYPEWKSAIEKLGDAQFRLLEFEAAARLHEDLTGVNSMRDRAWRKIGYSYFALGNYERAIEAFERSLAGEGAVFPWSAAALHLAWLNAKREGESPLVGMVERIEDPWGKAVCQMLLKQISEDRLIEIANEAADSKEQRGRLCEAYFYLGALRLPAGDKIAGRAMLAQAVATESVTFIEYTLAKAELARKR